MNDDLDQIVSKQQFYEPTKLPGFDPKVNVR